jgi:hypothetical protein
MSEHIGTAEQKAHEIHDRCRQLDISLSASKHVGPEIGACAACIEDGLVSWGTACANAVMAGCMSTIREREAALAGAVAFLKAVPTEGCIVSSAACSELEIATAQACGRFYVEPGGGHGWVIRPNSRGVNVGLSRRPACGKQLSDGIPCGTLLGDGHGRLLCGECSK